MVVYTIVGFIVVWGILGSLLIVGAMAVIEFWRTQKPAQQMFKVAQVDLEIQRARRRMISETLHQSRTTSDGVNGFDRWPRP